MSAAVKILANGDAVIAFTYDPDVVEHLKRGVPGHARTWIPDNKTWLVKAGPYVDVAIEIMRDEFRTVNVFDDHGTRVQDTPTGPDDAYSTLHLQPTGPPELVSAAYKCLAKMAHPDRGGTTTDMQAINHAVSIIRERQSA